MSQIGPRAFLHRLWTAFLTAVVCTMVVIGGAYFEAARKIAQVPTVKISNDVLQPGGNYLLVGSDSRAFVDTPGQASHFGSAQQESGQRSDTIMVAHVEASGDGFLVSFPRDLWVEIPSIGPSKINAAFNAGPQRLIETIERNFNIPISHYLQVDFVGFRNIVNALGTIPISFPTPARDTKSGLYINQAGCQHLNGDDALAYVRSRYYESYQNGAWHTDPLSDLGRIQRQQYFLRTLAQQVVRTSEHKPWRAPKLLDKMLANLQRDPHMSLSAMRALAYALHNERSNLETITIPTRPINIDGQSALALDDAKAAPIFARLRGAAVKPAPRPPSGISPASVHVSVRNGSGRAGLGSSTLDAFQRVGFSVVPPATNADRNDYAVTEVRYTPDAKTKAELVLAYLGGAGKLTPISASDDNADVVVIVGRDFAAVSAPQVSANNTSPTTRTAETAPAASTPTSPPSSLPGAGC